MLGRWVLILFDSSDMEFVALSIVVHGYGVLMYGRRGDGLVWWSCIVVCVLFVY